MKLDFERKGDEKRQKGMLLIVIWACTHIWKMRKKKKRVELERFKGVVRGKVELLRKNRKWKERIDEEGIEFGK